MTKVNNGMVPGTAATRTHASHEAAFTCHSNHLLKTGYTKVDSRAFAPPDGGPIRVLTKRSRFGAVLRNGKEGTRVMAPKMFGNRGGNIGSY